MSYKPTETLYTYDSAGNVVGCTITQYGGVGVNQSNGVLEDVAFPDPVVIRMTMVLDLIPPPPTDNANIQINCGYGSAAHSHCFISQAPANADMWFSYLYRIYIVGIGWVIYAFDTHHLTCHTWVFGSGFNATFSANGNQDCYLARISGTYSSFDAHCG